MGTMKLSVYLALTMTNCAFLSPSEGIPNLKDQSKIVGGHEAKAHSHPYIISLQLRIFYMRMHVCGGALLNEYFVVSAGHCTTESWLTKWLPMDAVAAMHNINTYNWPTQVIEIKERIPHPLYNGGIGPHDIALYETKSPFIFSSVVKPIQLTSHFKSLPDQISLKLVGWGALRTTLFIPDLPDYLQEVKVTPISFKDCYNLVEQLREGNEVNPLDADSNLCTGPTSGGIAGCTGDSGGPLVQINTFYKSPTPHSVEETTDETIHDENGEYTQVDQTESILVGVVSWGVSPCGKKGAPTVYTNVSTYIDFIDYNIKIRN